MTAESTAPDRPRPSPGGRRRWRIFFVMLFVGTLSYIDRSALSVGLPSIEQDLHISPATEGLLISSSFWTYAAMQIPAGWLLDRVGTRRVLVVVMTVWALTQFLTGIAQTVLVLFVARLVLGIVEAAGPVAGGKLASVWLPSQDRARGAMLSDSASALGGALGGFFIAGLIGLTGQWRLSFLIVGVVSIFAGAVVWLLLRDSPEQDPTIRQDELAYIESELALEDQRALADNAADLDDGRNPLVVIAQHRTAWATWLGFFFGNIVFYGLLTYGPIYLASERDVDIKQLAWALPVIFGAGFVGENIAGFVVQRWLRSGAHPNRVMKTMLGTSSIVAMLAIIGVAFVPGLGAGIGLLALTLFFLRWIGLYWSLPGTLVPRSRAGLFAGSMNLFSNVGGIVAPIVVGLIVQATGAYFWGLMFFAASAFLYFVCSMFIDTSGRLGHYRLDPQREPTRRREPAGDRSMTRIVVTDHTFPALPGAQTAASETGAELIEHRTAGDEAAVVAAVSGADAVLVQYAAISSAVLSALPPGALVVRYGIGVDNVDVAAAAERGIHVANVPDYGTDVVADHATAMLLALCRRLPWHDQQVRERGWYDAAEAGPFPSLAASTIGLLGGGRIATAVADRLRPFGCRVIAFDPFADAQTLAAHGIEPVDSVDELFARSDGLSLHAPATAQTHHTVDAERLALMRPHAVLVNTARGTLVDSSALLDALDRGGISAAALDVFEDEPLDAASAVARHPRILHSPHAAFYSQQSLERLERLAAEEVQRHLTGQPLRCEVRPPAR